MKDIILTVATKFNVTELAKEAYQNFPQAAINLPCSEYNYDKFLFSFYEAEEDKIHEVDLEKASNGVANLIEAWSRGECHFCGIDKLDDFRDTGNWDAIVFDAAMQYAIFNDIVYS